MTAHARFSASGAHRWIACPGSLALEAERWLPCEGIYEVSNLGGVRNTKRGKDLKPYRFSNGYLGVQLGAGNVRLVHRLVAAAFVPGDLLLQVNHKNGDRADNRAVNLEWVTCSENHKHSYRELSRKRHALTRPVVAGGVEYTSQSSAARALGVAPGSVCSAVLRGHRVAGLEVSL